jgi:hypothetical protein
MTHLELLIDSACQKSAIDDERVASDEARGVGRKKHRGPDQFFDLPKASHGRAKKEFLAALSAVQKRGVEIGSENSWRDGVDAYTVPRPLNSERLGQRRDCGFAGRVGSDLVQGHEGRQRRNINDAAIPAFHHVSVDHAACAKRSVQIRFQDRVPLRIGEVQRGSTLGPSGAIHKDLDVAENFPRGFKKMLDRGFVGNVASDLERTSSESLDLLCGGADKIGTASRGYDVSAGDGETLGQREADATRAADYQSRLALETQLRMTQVFLLSRSRRSVRFYREQAN